MKSKRIAGCLIVGLAGAELCEATEVRFANESLLALEPRSVSTLAANVHTHFEIDAEFRPTTVAPISVSGGQREAEMFRLFIYPTNSGFKLVGHPTLPEPDGRPAQPMYGMCQSVERLVEVLSANAGIPPLQLAAIRRTAQEGKLQEVGGSRPPIIRSFQRTELEQFGMNFRPVD